MRIDSHGNFMCDCLRDIIIKTQMPNGQINIQCENYDCQECKGNGFILNNKIYWTIQEENEEKNG